ncbi:MAG: hypothetical protein AVDCRST_MAG52-249, partial [uncultured Blastococcus sp.]
EVDDGMLAVPLDPGGGRLGPAAARDALAAAPCRAGEHLRRGRL